MSFPDLPSITAEYKAALDKILTAFPAQRFINTDLSVYVHAEDGSDTNPGTQAAPLRTIDEVYRRFGTFVLGAGVVTVNLMGDKAGLRVIQYPTRTILADGGRALQPTFRYVGPDMLRVRQCPAVQNIALSNRETTVTFASSIGGAGNAYAGSHFLRVRRGTNLATAEIPISQSADTTVVLSNDFTNGIIAAGDTYEIVVPAVAIAPVGLGTDPLATVFVRGVACGYPGLASPTFLRCQFLGFLFSAAVGAVYDRCQVQVPSNDNEHLFEDGYFVNTAFRMAVGGSGINRISFGGSCGDGVGPYDDGQLIDQDTKVSLVSYGCPFSLGGPGSFDINNSMSIQGVSNSVPAMEVQDVGAKAYLSGAVHSSGAKYALKAWRGGEIVFDPAAAYFSGATADLCCGTLEVALGAGVGQFSEADGYNGCLSAAGFGLVEQHRSTGDLSRIGSTSFSPQPQAGWEVVAAGAKQAIANRRYIADNGSLVTITLPATAAAAPVGSEIEVAGRGAGKWKIAQNANQLINTSAGATTTGVTGSLAAANRYDAARLVCVVAGIEWVLVSANGALVRA